MAGVLGVLADLAARLALGVELMSEREAARFRETAVARGLDVLAVVSVARGGGSGVRWKGCGM